MKKPRALIFDIDDTLVDTTPSYRGSIIATAAHFGAAVTLPDIAAIKAAGDANNDWVVTQTLLARQGIDVSLDEVTQKFEEFYQGTGGVPGLKTEEILLIQPAVLRELGETYKLGLVTGRPRKDALEFVEIYGLDGLFGAVVSMDDGPLKPDPAPVRSAMEKLGESNAWMIGDTPDDIRSGVAAGAFAVGVVAPADDPADAKAAMTAAGAGMVLDTVIAIVEVLS